MASLYSFCSAVARGPGAEGVGGGPAGDGDLETPFAVSSISMSVAIVSSVAECVAERVSTRVARLLHAVRLSDVGQIWRPCTRCSFTSWLLGHVRPNLSSRKCQACIHRKALTWLWPHGRRCSQSRPFRPSSDAQALERLRGSL